jgi:aminoglycoside N3'-acetyltransferase
MSEPNTFESLRRELSDLGLQPGMTVMVHSSLGRIGRTVGGPVTVIRALRNVLGAAGTMVMPAESPAVADLRDRVAGGGWVHTGSSHTDRDLERRHFSRPARTPTS